MNHVTKAVKSTDPNAEIQIDLSSQKITVKSVVAEQELVEAIEDAGYPVLKLAKKSLLRPVSEKGDLPHEDRN